MSTPLTLTPGRDPDGAVVLTAVGEIDMSNSATFAAALSDTRRDADGPFTVDLTAVEYIDSAGLAALFPHVDHLRLLSNQLLAPVLTIAGLDDITTFPAQS
ncbi:anti-anti-sigma factor [Paractinoplanes abujensis]|uniref:Anti-anti-sigma factor n=1 Tax=Paractinoplanes abujensis TaxID=882441 RepID=A0A7W7CT39_9ACTN|nr:STAS domain-containing protein [Actinoplanes abujensis]MBB4692466.1 anti-anti-sigma factor [Actinoplanes abujensis]GID24058.1 anti-anti-sigma factor [Actinoplanes abujensis]